MESRKGPKFRKKKKKKSDNKTLAERIMLEREAAAQEAERNSNKSQDSSSQETTSEPKPQATPKHQSEAASTPGSDGHISPSESVDISHLTKDSDQKKRTPTPEPTLSASHSNQLPGSSNAQKLPENQGSADQLRDEKVETVNDVQSSYQQPLQPAYAPYHSDNSLSSQSKSLQEPQPQRQQVPQQSSMSTPSQKQEGFQSEVSRSIPVTGNYVPTCKVSISTASTPPSSSSSPSVNGTTVTYSNCSATPAVGTVGYKTNPSHQQSHSIAHPQSTNSDYNQYMSLAQKIELQRKIVVICDSAPRQQPQENAGFESNAATTEGNQTSTPRDNNQLPEKQVQNVDPVAQVSQDPCPLSDKKCPINSPTTRNSLETDREPHQKEKIPQQNTNAHDTSQTVDNQASNDAKAPLVTEPKKADQTGKPSIQTPNQQPLPTNPDKEDLDTMNNFELEALEKMVDHDLQSLVSGTNSEDNTPVINKDLKNKVLSEEFQRKIDRFLNDI